MGFRERKTVTSAFLGFSSYCVLSCAVQIGRLLAGGRAEGPRGRGRDQRQVPGHPCCGVWGRGARNTRVLTSAWFGAGGCPRPARVASAARGRSDGERRGARPWAPTGRVAQEEEVQLSETTLETVFFRASVWGDGSFWRRTGVGVGLTRVLASVRLGRG